ncbi:MBOAT family O-acyltransferase [Okeania sp.]|uniref:MBOAT family O-acyltransferase n=1 Tax=Okeania sp. TaxID=3100323 RepID=UPI002B4B1D41|nr:MBOAT family O-acyltransferase [Okeania sp.]MEB3339863.1 MBOAT family O-acyltransferase [Okeania sp.]
MTFISFNYTLFLLIVLGIYWLTPRQSGRVFILLVASLIFYGTFQLQYIPLILIITLFNFYLAQAIGEPEDWRIANTQWNRRRLLLLWLGIICNVLLLLSFKYIPFLLNIIGIIYNLPKILETANWVDDNVTAPLGLSFFCFECLAYLIDIYRGAPAAASWLEFTSYKLFFPKLISGPITRYHYLQNQLGMTGKKNSEVLVKIPALKFPNLEKVTEGIWLIATGAAKKALIADNLGIFVDLSFSNLQRAGSGDLWLATVAYGLQLYLDFSAYVDIARGSAFLMGLNLPQNFDFPYFSKSIAEFWRRWHTTLGDWLRNYLYFPLGGSRVGLFGTCLNLLIVMLIAGIWHGAAWGFIVWGIWHGLGLVIHRLVDSFSKQFNLKKVWESWLGILLSWLLTQGMVFGGWIFFRLPNLRDSIWVIEHWWGYDADVQFADKVYLEVMGLERLQLVWLICVVVVAMVVNFWFHRGLKLQLNWHLKVLLVPVFLFTVWLLAPEGLPYIYFDF